MGTFIGAVCPKNAVDKVEVCMVIVIHRTTAGGCPVFAEGGICDIQCAFVIVYGTAPPCRVTDKRTVGQCQAADRVVHCSTLFNCGVCGKYAVCQC